MSTRFVHVSYIRNILVTSHHLLATCGRLVWPDEKQNLLYVCNRNLVYECQKYFICYIASFKKIYKINKEVQNNDKYKNLKTMEYNGVQKWKCIVILKPYWMIFNTIIYLRYLLNNSAIQYDIKWLFSVWYFSHISWVKR